MTVADVVMANQDRQQEESKAPLMPKKPLIHLGLRTQGFHMPAMNSPFCSKKYCIEVQQGLCFCFSVSLVTKVNLQRMPPVKILKEHLVKEMEKGKKQLAEKTKTKSYERLIAHLKLKDADKQWYLETLTILQKFGMPQEFLKPGYCYTKHPECDRPLMTKDQLSFYEFLPERLQIKVMMSAKEILTPKQRAQREIERYKNKVKELEHKMSEKQKKVESSDSDDDLEPKVIMTAKRYKQFEILMENEKKKNK